MLDAILGLHPCKSNSRSVRYAQNESASTLRLKSQQMGLSRMSERGRRASTDEHNVHAVVKFVLFLQCLSTIPYPRLFRTYRSSVPTRSASTKMLVSAESIFAIATAPNNPSTVPTHTSAAPSRSTSRSTCALLAPSAVRIVIFNHTAATE